MVENGSGDIPTLFVENKIDVPEQERRVDLYDIAKFRGNKVTRNGAIKVIEVKPDEKKKPYQLVPHIGISVKTGAEIDKPLLLLARELTRIGDLEFI